MRIIITAAVIVIAAVLSVVVVVVVDALCRVGVTTLCFFLGRWRVAVSIVNECEVRD